MRQDASLMPENNHAGRHDRNVAGAEPARGISAASHSSATRPEHERVPGNSASRFGDQIAAATSGLQVSHLRKSYGDFVAVNDLSFRVQAGEIFGLIGPNGAGKSTSMMMIIGLLQPDGGTITFDGKAYNPDDRQMRSYLGIVPQDLAIYPELTALENLQFFGGLYGLSGSRLKQRIEYVFELTGLTQNAHHKPSTFSGGMSRRLNFGIALLHEPRFVVLDEPTVGIDPQSRTNLLDGVRELSRNGVGIIYTSHYMEEIEAICDRVGIIDHGRLLRQGTLDELLDRSQPGLCIKVGSLSTDATARLSDVAHVMTDDEGKTRIVIRQDESQNSHQTATLRSVLDLLDAAGIPLLGIETQETSLETLFLQLTGRKLRD